MLPKIDGYEILANIKENIVLSDVPVIILSAKTNPGAIVKGFRMGAIDYFPKPFQVGELVLRVKNLLADKNSVNDGEYHATVG
jgi:DNA-binding response OmpR family regulator